MLCAFGQDDLSYQVFVILSWHFEPLEVAVFNILTCHVFLGLSELVHFLQFSSQSICKESVSNAFSCVSGEPFIDGQAVPYDPKYHEEWVRNNDIMNRHGSCNCYKWRHHVERRRENTQAY